MGNFFTNIFTKSNNGRGVVVTLELGEVEKKIKEGAILIDVRSPQEYQEGHLNNSINIPEYEIKRRIEMQVRDKNTEIIVYCNSGRRSRRAADTLKKLNYINVYNLIQGIYSY